MITFVSYDGTALVCHERGEGPALICLPGGPGRSAAYLEDLGGLAARRRLLLLDKRGTGQSAQPEDPASYAMHRMVADVEALRLRLELDRIDLLGHSAAGGLALLYAARYPHRIRHLVLVTPSLGPVGIEPTDEQWYAELEQRASESWYDDALVAVKAWEAGDESRRPDAQPFLYSPWNAAAEAHAQRYVEPPVPGLVEHYATDLPDPAATRARLATVMAPVLVIAGEHDAAPTRAHTAEAAAIFARGTSVVLPGAHFPWVTAPDEFANAGTTFLQS